MEHLTSAQRQLQRRAEQWAQDFAECVRARDLLGGSLLFAPSVHSYGTRTIEADGLGQLLREQWEPTWMRTAGFHYLPDTMHVIPSPDRRLAVVTARWASTGVDDASCWGLQTPYARSGRCSMVLLQQPDESLLCVHTHFSMDPGA